MLIKHIKRLDGATHHDENIVDCLLNECMGKRADYQLVAKFLAPSSRLKDFEEKKNRNIHRTILDDAESGFKIIVLKFIITGLNCFCYLKIQVYSRTTSS